jgi:hypothetical protein
MFRFLPLVAAVMFAVAGFNVFDTPSCESVSFDYRGARVVTIECFPDASGAVPADLAGLGLLAGAGLMSWISWNLRRRPSQRSGFNSAGSDLQPPTPPLA